MSLAGWLTIIAGILALVNGLTTLFRESSLLAFDIVIPVDRYSICGIAVILFGAVAIAGGVSAIRRKSFTLALAGAALGTIGDGLPGIVLGLSAIGLLFLSNEDI